VPGLGEVSTRDTLDDRRLLIDLLASGARDEQIAGVLGISLRTVRRRVAELLTELDASSRFQAGAEAVRRGRL
jgi:DNA-binding NarL/FixJ family response regulator